MKKWSVFNFLNDFLGYVWADNQRDAMEQARTEYDEEVYVRPASKTAVME